MASPNSTSFIDGTTIIIPNNTSGSPYVQVNGPSLDAVQLSSLLDAACLISQPPGMSSIQRAI